MESVDKESFDKLIKEKHATLVEERRNQVRDQWRLAREFRKEQSRIHHQQAENLNCNVSEAKEKFLQPVTPLPPMRCYVPIDENVKAEDETLLAYLPYFGESAESCVDEIVESYGGCNDNTSSMDTSIDDSIIKSLVETATDKISETNEGYSSDHNGLDVFQAICEAIPLKISPQKLLQKFNNMKKLDAPDAEVHDEEPCEERSIQDNEAPHKEQLPDKNVKPNAVRKLASTSRKRKVPSLGQNGTRNYCTPCDHEGKCSAECSCFGKKNYCETFCKCAADCSRRFPGCNCKGQCKSNACSCFKARRECDPVLCKCQQKEPSVDKCCKNAGIQNKTTKKLKLAPSQVSGWGIFAEEPIKKNDFISEYCGELISQKEADRRGQIYEARGCSYLFDLTSEFCIDSTRKGNESRFINHSDIPNCDSKVVNVNGHYRIGIFAKKDIGTGNELFFHYQYTKKDELTYFKK